jgi:hypothetical protein
MNRASRLRWQNFNREVSGEGKKSPLVSSLTAIDGTMRMVLSSSESQIGELRA